MCKFSIVVPIYNVEPYLSDCLSSIERQSNKDFEVVLVNDGSTDKSGEIAKQYQNSHSNVKYIEQKNMGLSEARNTGIINAMGEYIVFLDSDDWIADNMVERLYELLTDTVDVILFTAKKIYYDTGETEHFGYTKIMEGVRSGLEIYHYLQINDEYYTCVWLQCVRKKFIQDYKIWFYPGIIHEDHMFSFFTFVNASKCVMIPDEVYYYRVRSNSIMTSHADGFTRNFVGMTVSYQEMANWYFKSREDVRIKKYRIGFMKHLYWVNIWTRSFYNLLTDKEKENNVELKSQVDKLWSEIRKLKEYKAFVVNKDCVWVIRKIKRIFSILNEVIIKGMRTVDGGR